MPLRLGHEKFRSEVITLTGREDMVPNDCVGYFSAIGPEKLKNQEVLGLILFFVRSGVYSELPLCQARGAASRKGANKIPMSEKIVKRMCYTCVKS